MPFLSVPDACWIAFIVVCGLMTFMTWPRKPKSPKPEPEPMTLYGLLETNNTGLRSWFTPFDIQSMAKATAEAVRGIARDPEIHHITVYALEGGKAVPIFTIGRPDQ